MDVGGSEMPSTSSLSSLPSGNNHILSSLGNPVALSSFGNHPVVSSLGYTTLPSLSGNSVVVRHRSEGHDDPSLDTIGMTSLENVSVLGDSSSRLRSSGSRRWRGNNRLWDWISRYTCGSLSSSSSSSSSSSL